MTVTIRKPYDPVERVAFECQGPTVVKASFQDECDINRIMRKFEKQGVVTHLRQVEGRYGDFCSAPEYHEACNQVVAAREMFATVPAKIRKRFNNDPAEFLEFAQDPGNVDELREMGLARPESTRAKQEAPGGPEGGAEAPPPAPEPEPPQAA